MIRALLLCLILCLPAQAQAVIEGESNVAPYGMVRLRASNLPAKSGVLWGVYPPTVTVAEGCDPLTLQFAGPPGNYVVEMILVTIAPDGTPILARVQKAVTIQPPVPPNPGPQPNPNPGPQPNPPVPGPIGKAWVVVVEETAEARADRGRFLTDRALGDFVRSHGWSVRLVDQNVQGSNGLPPADLVPYLNRARQKGLPYLAVVDERGIVYLEGGVPATPAALLEMFQRLGGGR